MSLVAATLASCARSASSTADPGPTPIATLVAQAVTAQPLAAQPTATSAATPRPTLAPTLAPAQHTSAAAAGNSKTVVAKAATPTMPPEPAMSVAPVAPPVAQSPNPSASSTGPKIYSVATQPSVVHTGESVTWNVRTSSDVVSVTAHVSAYTLPLQPQGPGHFFLGFTIPSTVPAVFHGTYNLELTARTQSGATATRSVPMVFQ